MVFLGVVMSGCAESYDSNASKAYDAVEAKNWDEASEHADKAYAGLSELTPENLCRLAVAYAMIAVVKGDDVATDRFMECYAASMENDPVSAEKFYNSLDENMSQNLTIISGLIKLSEAMGQKGIAGSAGN